MTPSLAFCLAVFAPLCLGILQAHAASDREPSANGLLLSLTVPPREGDRFQHAEFSFWVADPARPIKAVIVHQHGCTNASPDRHPPVTIDWHWRALARKHDCALLVPMYQVAGNCDEWNDPDSGSERALMDALTDLGQQAKRPELKEVPWVLWGHSGGSSWSAQMIVRHPRRILAASFRGGCHKQFGDPAFRRQFADVALGIPLLLVWGKRESVPSSSHYVSWEPMNTMYHQIRSLGAPTCRLIDPLSEHGCDNSRLVVIPFFDVILDSHLNHHPLPGALMNIESLEPWAAGVEAASNPAATWLPTPELAKLWSEFSKTGSIKLVKRHLTAPALEVIRNANGYPVLRWNVDPNIVGGLRALRIYRDGNPWRELGVKPDAFIATSRDATPVELRRPCLTDDTATSGETHAYSLTFLDAAGNESPHSATR